MGARSPRAVAWMTFGRVWMTTWKRALFSKTGNRRGSRTLVDGSAKTENHSSLGPFTHDTEMVAKSKRKKNGIICCECLRVTLASARWECCMWQARKIKVHICRQYAGKCASVPCVKWASPWLRGHLCYSPKRPFQMDFGSETFLGSWSPSFTSGDSGASATEWFHLWNWELRKATQVPPA